MRLIAEQLPESYPTTRSNGINENIYQFQSGGVYNQNQLVVNYSVHARRATLFGFYTLNFAKADTFGATYFPSNQFDPGEDYGRSNFDVRNRFLLGGNMQLPYEISVSPFVVTDSGAPFNIMLSQNLSGNNQFNDRPAFATSTSTDTITTSDGRFDLDPAWNQQRIPYNFGNGPKQFSMNTRISKSFGIGPRVGSGTQSSFGGPGDGPGPSGLSGSNGPPRLDQELPRRYTLSFAAMGRNVFNNVSLGQPVGVLQSPLFGKSTSLLRGFFSSAAANRSIDLQIMFSF